MRTYFGPWLVLSLADEIIVCSKVAGVLKIALWYFIIKLKTARNSEKVLSFSVAIGVF